ncbi:MAG: hypothetical protein IH591_01955 [Bacteroidales bacterium]|nr:hypothetical protein [Bacteroidales bacterium]
MECIQRKSGFSRKGDPLDDMQIGLCSSVNDVLGEGENCINCAFGKVEIIGGTTLVIHVTEGSLAMRSLRREILATKLGIKKVVLDVKPPAVCTILDELDTEDIYKRIMGTYRKIISNNGDFDAEKVEKNRKYIEGLSDDPTSVDLKGLADAISSGDLEYAFKAKDEFSVSMGTYARELSKRLENLEF